MWPGFGNPVTPKVGVMQSYWALLKATCVSCLLVCHLACWHSWFGIHWGQNVENRKLSKCVGPTFRQITRPIIVATLTIMVQNFALDVSFQNHVQSPKYLNRLSRNMRFRGENF